MLQASKNHPDDAEPTVIEMRPIARMRTLGVVLSLLTAVLIFQLMRYQVWGGLEVPPAPQIAPESSPRGTIVDRSGTPLVVNRYFFQVTATPEHFKSQEDRHEVAQQLADLINLPYQNTLDILGADPSAKYALLTDAITLEDAQKIEQHKTELAAKYDAFPLQSVYVTPKALRFYPQGELFSHVLGFVHRGEQGVTGVEKYYQQFLLRDGIGLLDANRTPIQDLPVEVQSFVPSSVGKDLVLSLDRTIQWICREELARGLAEFKAVAGTIIVMDPHSGAILGMASLPDYDPNDYLNAPDGSVFNPAVSAQWEPGSIFKIITMAAALDSGKIEPTTIFTDSGSITVGDRPIFNSDRVGHGLVSTTDALALSLNVVTAQIAQTLGADLFYRYVRQFGFGEASYVDLADEISGIVKTPRNQLWSPSDLGTNSFGQGLAATPLQMANATAAIANGGWLMRPYAVEMRIAGDEMQVAEPRYVRQVITPETAAEISEMMAQVIERSNSRAQVPGYRMAGKSGTAQIPGPGGYEKEATIVSFVGFGPVDDPQIVILVKMDRPDSSVNPWAGQTAAPVFSRVAKRIFEYLNVPPDEIRLAGLD
jgi:cell division protein FtsI/penicillin-binding protein 2